MIRAETIVYQPDRVADLHRLVARGEGQLLEFKRKASYPDKIVREMIALANTDGGTLLIGVDDNGTIPGVKYPEEESVVIHRELTRHCRPAMEFTETWIALSDKRYVLKWEIPRSQRRPHFYAVDQTRECYVRLADQSLKASREMAEILRRRKSAKGTQFTYGPAEEKLMRALEVNPTISLKEFSKLTGLNRFVSSRKLIKLVLANVLEIRPTEKGDLFSRK